MVAANVNTVLGRHMFPPPPSPAVAPPSNVDGFPPPSKYLPPLYFEGRAPPAHVMWKAAPADRGAGPEVLTPPPSLLPPHVMKAAPPAPPSFPPPPLPPSITDLEQRMRHTDAETEYLWTVPGALTIEIQKSRAEEDRLREEFTELLSARDEFTEFLLRRRDDQNPSA